MAISARIDELKKKFDENPRRYFAPLANEYRKAGDLDQAIFICQEYLPLQPGHMSGHIVYGQALFDMSRNDEAKAVFETALSLDPENLIALRHLGDIARKSGDTTAARVWYQKVLEADPRNEEIAQIMISLLAAPAPAASPEPPAPAPSVPDIPRTSRAVGVATPPSSGTLEVEQSRDASPLVAQPEPPPLPPPLPPPTPESAPKSHELLDIEDFSIGGAPAPAEEKPAPGATAEATESVPQADIDPDKTGVFDLGREDGPFEADPYAIAATPEPAPAEASAPDISVSVDDHASSSKPIEAAPEAEPPVDGLETFEAGIIAVPPGAVVAASGLETESFFDIEAAPPPAAPSSEQIAAPVADSTESTAPHEAAGTDATAEMQADSGAPAPPVAAEDAPAAEASEPAEVATADEAPAEAFVTETMAELYLQQGHIDSALEIYRRLVELRPNEPPLRERLRALEEYGHAKASDAAVETEATEATTEYAGPTIREFLVGLTTRRAPARVEPEPVAETSADQIDEPHVDDTVAPNAYAPDEYAADTYAAEPYVADTYAGEPPVDETPVAETYVEETYVEETPVDESVAESFEEPASQAAPEQEPRVGQARPTPSFAAETVSGSIDALFGGADSSESDTNAAATLADAFASEPAPEPPELRGVPAHLASRELSLDHVFKSRTPARSSSDGFSFDQFFAGDAQESGSSPSGDAHGAGAPPEGADDVAQFNAWLNGLKKT